MTRANFQLTLLATLLAPFVRLFEDRRALESIPTMQAEPFEEDGIATWSTYRPGDEFVWIEATDTAAPAKLYLRDLHVSESAPIAYRKPPLPRIPGS
jgi:hypothetical protein